MSDTDTKTNKGAFRKGEKRPNQGKHGSPKSTVMAREAIARFADGNADKIQGWLDSVANDDKHGPYVAFKMLMEVMEYHLPKLARTEHVGDKENPVGIVFSWQK